MSGKTLSAVLLPLVGLVSCSGPGPHLHVPTPEHGQYTGLEIRSIAAVSAREVWVVGWLLRADGTPEGLILGTESGGTRWRRQGVDTADLDGVVLHSVFFTDRLRGWVAGTRVRDGRTVPICLATRDGGGHYREISLPENPESTVTEIHSLHFTDDSNGSLRVSCVLGGGGETFENAYTTADGGRTWLVSEYRAAVTAPFHDQTEAFVNDDLGFRVRRSEIPGLTVVYTTGSGGRDWVPISEMSLDHLPSWY